MRSKYTAVVKQDGKFWIGWVEGIPGVNCQEVSCDELNTSLQEALREALDLNRNGSAVAAGG